MQTRLVVTFTAPCGVHNGNIRFQHKVHTSCAFMPGIPSYRATSSQLHGAHAHSHTTPGYSRAEHLVHLPDELVDVGFPVTKVTALDKVLEFPCPPATSGVRQLERPKEVGCLPQSRVRINDQLRS